MLYNVTSEKVGRLGKRLLDLTGRQAEAPGRVTIRPERHLSGVENAMIAPGRLLHNRKGCVQVREGPLPDRKGKVLNLNRN